MLWQWKSGERWFSSTKRKKPWAKLKSLFQNREKDGNEWSSASTTWGERERGSEQRKPQGGFHFVRNSQVGPNPNYLLLRLWGSPGLHQTQLWGLSSDSFASVEGHPIWTNPFQFPLYHFFKGLYTGLLHIQPSKRALILRKGPLV